MFILQIPHSSSKKPKIWKMQTKIFFVNILPQFLTNIKKMYSYFRQMLKKNFWFRKTKIYSWPSLKGEK